MSMSIEIIKTIILSCQVAASGPSGSNFEYVMARQKNCQRDAVRCVMDLAKEHANPSELTEYDLVLCLSDLTPEKIAVEPKKPDTPKQVSAPQKKK